MADESNAKIHNIFITNPLDLKKYVDSFIVVRLENNTELSGTVYTIDPVSERLVLSGKILYIVHSKKPVLRLFYLIIALNCVIETLFLS